MKDYHNLPIWCWWLLIGATLFLLLAELNVIRICISILWHEHESDFHRKESQRDDKKSDGENQQPPGKSQHLASQQFSEVSAACEEMCALGKKFTVGSDEVSPLHPLNVGKVGVGLLADVTLFYWGFLGLLGCRHGKAKHTKPKPPRKGKPNNRQGGL